MEIEAHARGLKPVDVHHETGKFARACAEACPTYSRKYSCPPFAPSFGSLSRPYSHLHCLCLRIALEQLPEYPNPYHRVRMANAMLKPRLERMLFWWRDQDPGSTILGSGSCRACRPCGCVEGVPCKKPQRRIYSLEATGVDCEHLVQTCFGFGLEWYSTGHPPQHQLVVGAVLSDRRDPPPIARLLGVIDG